MKVFLKISLLFPGSSNNIFFLHILLVHKSLGESNVKQPLKEQDTVKELKSQVASKQESSKTERLIHQECHLTKMEKTLEYLE